MPDFSGFRFLVLLWNSNFFENISSSYKYPIKVSFDNMHWERLQLANLGIVL